MRARVDYTPVLKALIAAAETGAATPTNAELGGLVVGSRSVRNIDAGGSALTALIHARLIEVIRPGPKLRQVRIVSSGKMTAPTKIFTGPMRRGSEPNTAFLPAARDACFRCGTRADLHAAQGCWGLGEARYSFQQEEHAP